LGHGESPIVYGDGSQKYDFITVEDTARANLCAMASSVSGDCYNVGRGIGTTIKELTDLLIELYGSKQRIVYEPAGRTFVTNRIGSTKKAEQDLGFKWKDDLGIGLTRLIEWRRADEGLSHRCIHQKK
jgi:UDP-glucose 4-epimerase